jgi:DNA-binding CsgD family transcriptional regulator
MRVIADLAERARDRREPSAAPAPELLDRAAASLNIVGEHDRAQRALFVAERVRLQTANGESAGATGSSGPGDGTEVRAWTTTVDACRAAADPALVAYALFRLAAAHCVVNDKASATTALQEAFAISSQIGAKPIIDEALALARRARLPLGDAAIGVNDVQTKVSDDGSLAGEVGAQVGGQVGGQVGAPRDELARFGLTDREREVLTLLLLGRSNPQIAKELFISPKTASVHVSNILAKLGVSSRMEAAALAHRLGVGGTAS